MTATGKSSVQDELRALRHAIKLGGDPLATLKQRFRGRTALVVSCGPSMKRWQEVLAGMPDDTVVVGIKQAVNVLGAQCHLHFSNPYNRQKYTLAESCLTIYCGVINAPPVFGRREVNLEVVKTNEDRLDSTLAVHRDFAKHTLAARGASRPWGPGIMYEAVLYTLLHMGFTEVTTVAWDIANPEGANQHFDDPWNDATAVSGSPKPALRSRLGMLSTMIDRPATRTVIAFIRYHLGHRYNRAGMDANEAELVSRSIGTCLSWFAAEGMKVRVISNSTWMRDAKMLQDSNR